MYIPPTVKKKKFSEVLYLYLYIFLCHSSIVISTTELAIQVNVNSLPLFATSQAISKVHLFSAEADSPESRN